MRIFQQNVKYINYKSNNWQRRYIDVDGHNTQKNKFIYFII